MKRSRAWRRNQKERVVNNRLREMRDMGIAKEEWRVIKEPHRMEKQHPLDCGKAGCLLCHYEKILFKDSSYHVQKDSYVEDIEEENDD